MKYFLLALTLLSAQAFAFTPRHFLPSTATLCSSISTTTTTSLQVLSENKGAAGSSEPWTPTSWEAFIPHQMPVYDDAAALKEATDELSKFSPLVFAGEVRELHTQLAKATQGQGFLMMGGDCAESFDEFNVDHVRDTFRVILQMALIMTFGGAMPIIKIGRMAGQFAKPRSEPNEVKDGVSLPSYRGDIVNAEEFTAEARKNDPGKMVRAYHQSAQTLNILRAFSTGGERRAA